jgi:outer membrane protein
MEWQQEKDNLTINIILAYLQVLSNGDQLEQTKNQLAVSAGQIERLEVLNKEGAIRPAELSELKGQYAGDQLSIINAQNALETARINLCRFMNVPYDKDLSLEKIEPESFAAKYDGDPAGIYQTALKQLALIKAVDLRQQSANKAVKVAKGQLFPTLSFGANASTRYVSGATQSQYINTVYAPTSDTVIVNSVKYPVLRFQDNFTLPTKFSYRDQLSNNINTSYGFSLNIPIFNSLSQRTRVKQAQVNLKIAEFTAKTTRTQLGRDIDEAYINMNSAGERYKVLQEQAGAYNESFRSAGILYQQGVYNSFEYLTAKNNFDRVSINLIIAKYDYVLRTKVLDYYQGKQLW